MKPLSVSAIAGIALATALRAGVGQKPLTPLQLAETLPGDPAVAKRIAAEVAMNREGFALGATLATEFARPLWAADPILSRVRAVPSTTGKWRAPLFDETSRAEGARLGGASAAWGGESEEGIPSFPKFRAVNVDVPKVRIAVVQTEEFLEDAPTSGQLILDALREELGHTVGGQIVVGSGQGRPLGLVGASAQIVVAKEAAQPAGTIVAANISKMRARSFMNGRDPSAVVWLVGQSAWPQITAIEGYVPAVGIDLAAPWGRLDGSPIVPCESCSVVGTLGDIILTDLSAYLLIFMDLRIRESMHVRFLRDERLVMLTWRVDGQPMWAVPSVPKNGTDTVSPIVVLATRS